MKKYLALASTTLLVACSAVPTQQAATQAVELRFVAEVNGQPFECGQSYKNIGTTRSTITPSDFRMYVSQVQLTTADGKTVPVQLTQDKTWQLEGIALLDFENGQGPCRNGTLPMNTVIRGSVPAGQYKGVIFTVGVPFDLNHGDPTVAPAPLSSTAMFWNWQGGYKFIKFDTASSGRPQIVANFDVNKNQVVVDIGKVLTGANVDVNAPKTSPGCMSFPNDPDCPAIMNAMGLAYDGKAPAGPQQFISKR